jgi:hypothetical protein
MLDEHDQSYMLDYCRRRPRRLTHAKLGKASVALPGIGLLVLAGILQYAVDHPHSTFNFDLLFWMTACVFFVAGFFLAVASMIRSSGSRWGIAGIVVNGCAALFLLLYVLTLTHAATGIDH